jgi:hypothetical protein
MKPSLAGKENQIKADFSTMYRLEELITKIHFAGSHGCN